MADSYLSFLKFLYIYCIFISSGTLCQRINGMEGLGALDGLADLASSLGGLFNTMNECEYTCKAGKVPEQRSGHKPTTNGCGSYGVKVDVSSYPQVEKCCDKHDICYDTCGKDKAACDREFKKCIDDICVRQTSMAKQKECSDLSKLLYGGTAALGCDAFLKSQKKACKCVKPKKRRKNEL